VGRKLIHQSGFGQERAIVPNVEEIGYDGPLQFAFVVGFSHPNTVELPTLVKMAIVRGELLLVRTPLYQKKYPYPLCTNYFYTEIQMAVCVP